MVYVSPNSFGYPACPDLEHQEALFAALRPEEIGVELTEGGMMDPEANVQKVPPRPSEELGYLASVPRVVNMVRFLYGPHHEC